MSAERDLTFQSMTSSETTITMTLVTVVLLRRENYIAGGKKKKENKIIHGLASTQLQNAKKGLAMDLHLMSK